MTEKAKTNDEGKAPLAWLPWAAVEGMSMVQAFGHSKYKDFNNYRKGMEVSRNLSCALRHIKEYMEGIDQDHESGRNPLEHAMCRIAFVLQNLQDGVAIDDRYKKPADPMESYQQLAAGQLESDGDPLPMTARDAIESNIANARIYHADREA